ncbi:uncharacterized protein B0H18DRAFT_1121418 [Fomitopsis serialis]|uniref:uncharacterized protein n=1 Tax=Fomitopsis serialis TaxID=139415 RepID=UPI002007F61C|nr:uncharacterized protein B0H18DRAFT_1121418 [Neoantrodia serialis]KAH9921453.1 hypothetical protein B0H18DRAFT_1121418 [Neoantrodia serialis]
MSNTARAQELKAEGNTLFGQGEYTTASAKYAEALQHDDQSAILYANRAACSLHLRKFDEAKVDAEKAVELDPGYAKGWGRLAAACDGLQEYEKSAVCWRRALAALPQRDVTAAELNQKEQCEAGEKDALTKLAKATGILVDGDSMKGKWPWDRVAAMEDELQAGYPKNADSSAWVMLRAVRLWDRGSRGMTQVKTRMTPAGLQWGGCDGVLASLTDAILTDVRVFRIEGFQWLEMFNKQAKLEARRTGAWPSLTVERIQAEAVKRQQQEGWDAARNAVDVTVRIWVMQGFLATHVNANTQVALQHFNAALDLLNWGRTASWRDASARDRGDVFEDYFVRAVRGLRLEVLRADCAILPHPEAALQTLYEEVQSMISEIPEVETVVLTEGGRGPGFVSAFSIYLKAHALTTVGFYHQKIVDQYPPREEDGATIVKHYLEAHVAYLEAAMLYPKDDEKHAWFLHVAFDALRMCGGPFGLALNVTKQMRLALPHIMKIWQFSQAAKQGAYVCCEEVLKIGRKIEKDLADGKITLEDPMLPNYAPWTP